MYNHNNGGDGSNIPVVAATLDDSSTAAGLPIATATLQNDNSSRPSAYAPSASSSQPQPSDGRQQHEHQYLQNANMGRSSRVMAGMNCSYRELSEDKVHRLKNQGFTNGLIHALARNVQVFPLRIWVVDNSGSMSSGDGHRMVATSKKQDVRLVPCSRWAELQETVDYHAQMAALLVAPTVFRLLNDPGRIVGPQQFSIAEQHQHPHDNSTSSTMIQKELKLVQLTMKQATPSGVTPLSDHVNEIRSNIMELRDELIQNGQRVTVVLATDGLPTDDFGISSESVRNEFVQSLRSLEGLPIWLVIRLCTDEESVTEYYNQLDSQLELSLEVLDDFMGEAQEVYEHNPWLNYALPIHRIREMGFHHRLFDLLDERLLTLDEVREFLILLFGLDRFDGVPDHHVEFHDFLTSLERIIHDEKKQWNPVSKKMQYWVDMKQLKKSFSDSSSCSLM
eukprot:scaffold1794_cov107-Cylindrotheca_fusiformis.AAC.7